MTRPLAPLAVCVLLAGCGGTASHAATITAADVSACLKQTDGVVVSQVPTGGQVPIEHATDALVVSFPLDGKTPGSEAIVLFAPSEDEAKLIPSSLEQLMRRRFPSMKLERREDALHFRVNTLYAWAGDHAESSQKTLEDCLSA
jgi:hypothetical protein